ncbi:MAG: hypothetical protein IAG13_04610, partial [Deltaproteobacteria bacterium]|nr:hypothetical protein [Nannocystaceae bacterium]
GALEYDSPDYDRDVDAEYRAGLNFVNLEAGEYVMTVEVMDHYNEPVRASVSLIVEGAVDDTGPVSDDGGSEGGSENDGEGEGGSDDDGSDDAPITAGDDSDPSGTGDGGASGDDGGVGSRGCACSSGNGPGYASMFPMVMALALLRRRARMDGG